MNHRILIYSMDEQKEILPAGQKWLTLRSINWMEHCKGLVVTAADDQSSFDSPQLWYFPIKEGIAKKLTNNLNGYAFSSMDNKSKQLAAIEPESYSNLFIVSNNAAASAQPLTEGTKKHDGMKGVRWLNDDQIIYSSQSGGYDNIWMTNGKGGTETQITSGAFVDRTPHAIPGRNTIVFSSNRSGSFNIWKCDVSGSNVKQLTHGNYDIEPSVTSDGRWIVYGSFGDSASSIWKMTVNGDSTQLLTTKHVQSYAISPDGQSLAYIYFNDEQKQKLAVISLSTRQVINEIDYQYGISCWTPDGKGFAHIDTKNDVSNIWTVPAAGGKPKQVTDFKSGRIFSFDWTRDGRKLIVARGESNSDIVLLTDADKAQQ